MTYPVAGGISFVARPDGLVLYIVSGTTMRPPDKAYHVNSGIEYGGSISVPTRSTTVNGTAGVYGRIKGGTTAHPLNVTDGTNDPDYGLTYRLVHDGTL